MEVSFVSTTFFVKQHGNGTSTILMVFSRKDGDFPWRHVDLLQSFFVDPELQNLHGFSAIFDDGRKFLHGRSSFKQVICTLFRIVSQAMLKQLCKVVPLFHKKTSAFSSFLKTES